MQQLNDKIDLERFYSKLAASQKRLLMLDYDGTLSPLVVERDQAVPYPEVTSTLDELIWSAETRTVIISGRTIDMLKKLLGTERLPELWGCHGLERLSRAGEYSIVDMSEDMRERLAELYDWTAKNNLVNFCEFKPSGGAFHWRGLPDEEREQIHRLVVDRWKDVAQETSLELFEFDGGVEIRVAGTNKGTPVSQLLGEIDDETTAAYLGDDFTDEDAFAAMAGRGLSVLVRSELRQTKADIWIEPPDELVAFLRRWV